MMLSQQNSYVSIFMTYKPSKLGQTDLVFGSSVGLSMQDYKSLHVTVAT